MQAVPSLVATGTVVATGAAGLVLVRKTDDAQVSTTSGYNRPTPSKRRLTLDYERPRMLPVFAVHTVPHVPDRGPLDSHPPAPEDVPYISFRRLGTALPSAFALRSAARRNLVSSQAPPPTIHLTSSETTSRRPSFIRPSTDLASRPIAENPRDSSSSRDSSWIRRLSIRPLSQHGNIRSGADLALPPLSLSQSPAAPALASSPSAPALQPRPNKLIKRISSVQGDGPGPLSRRGSRSHMLSLRRPATSHQRTATLQQFQAQGGFSGPPPLASAQSEAHTSLVQQQQQEPAFAPPSRNVSMTEERTLCHESTTLGVDGCTSFFRPRPSKPLGRSGSVRFSEDISGGSPVASASVRRVSLNLGAAPRAYLARTGLISNFNHVSPDLAVEPSRVDGNQQEGAETSARVAPSTTSNQSAPAKLARSISMHFSSPTTWVSRTGSIRRPKRASMDTSRRDGKRHASDPESSIRDRGATPKENKAISAQDEHMSVVEPRSHLLPRSASATDTSTAFQGQPRKRNSSSPLPSLKRLSSFHLGDAPRDLHSSCSSTGSHKPVQNTAGCVPRPQSSVTPVSPSRGVSGERSSTLVSSDLEGRDGTSGDDEDTDFKSDTMFDSFRTIASSNRMRTVETPLDSMFDESPPSTAGNCKTKRLSIHEILGHGVWDGARKTIEEEECLATPIRAVHAVHLNKTVDIDDGNETSDEDDFNFDDDDDDDNDDDVDDDDDGSSIDLDRTEQDFRRLSLIVDQDEWAEDDQMALSNHLSPPSSALNSRGVSPILPHALASVGINGSHISLRTSMASERTRSNIFDWSEPTTHEKTEADGHSPRPKTVHGKQDRDLRGGRSVTRKGPSAAHIRSQSVPVVPDPVSDSSKPAASKFGTWGLGTKTASEDWDEDFDFDDEGDAATSSLDCKDSALSFSVIVPASIQATQPTVKAHSSQIRELSLLVNDLKRLCRHGRELELMDGGAAEKWREAENIIALASPDEELEDMDEDMGDMDVDMDDSEIKAVALAEDVEGFGDAVDKRLVEEGFDGPVMMDHAGDPFELVEPAPMTLTTVVKERHVVPRRSVFSPEDDIFGSTWPLGGGSPSSPSRISEEIVSEGQQPCPQTPNHLRPPSMIATSTPSNRNSAVIATVIEAMQQQQQQQQRSTSETVRSVLSPAKPSVSNSKLFFDTNSLQELVKRAGHLRDSLANAVRHAELLTQSPAGTPQRRDRASQLSWSSSSYRYQQNSDGSPAFTRVFSDPAAEPGTPARKKMMV